MAEDGSGKRKGPGVLGCFGLLIFFAIESAVGMGVGYLAWLPMNALIASIVPASEADFAGVCAVCLAFIPAMLAMWLVDRLCRRLTGESVWDWVPWIP
ncbi:hypothetical protein PQ455_09920 [Sphingomonas naphthae]|uniref:MFS transporter n=1 Tax=Sphingomonas naphthae TaxID=1813468 RepID=A0ABY7TFY5_9SPHN|nr:hypothetical protein [Sphingomonas naphthae]WCT71968.1 hypothetical protein PQ455_09920 [Sphingomonas naphthae]